jgi:hypothetical protein
MRDRQTAEEDAGERQIMEAPWTCLTIRGLSG